MANQNRWRTFPAGCLRLVRPLTTCFTHNDTADISTRPPASLPFPDHDPVASIPRLGHEDQDPLQHTPVASAMEYRRSHSSRGRKSTAEKEVTPKPPTCTICTEVKRDEELLKPCRRCEDHWCHGCIRTFFIGATWDCDRMPARCCQKVMHHGIAKGKSSHLKMQRGHPSRFRNMA